MKFRFSRHAEKEINRRDIPLTFVRAVLEAPQQIVDEYGGKTILTPMRSGHSEVVEVRLSA